MSETTQATQFYLILRAAASPLLVLLAVTGGYAGIFAVDLLAETAERPAEGHGAGFAGLAFILLTLAGFGTCLLCILSLWLLWRKREKPA